MSPVRLSQRFSLLALLALALVGSCTQGDEQEPQSLGPSTSATRPVTPAATPTMTPSVPPSGDDPVARPTVRLAVIGDYGTGDASEASVARAVRRWAQANRADALVTTGDNVYPEGQPVSFDAAWSDPYGWVEKRGLDIVASLGNHDIEEDGGASVIDLLEMPGPWYSSTIGDADLFVLDANRPSDPAQQQWLEKTLEQSDGRWKIVVFHQPAFSCAYHDGTPEIVERWVPIFERWGVDLVLNGHDHAYQRFEALNGVTYVVTGGGGASLYELDACAEGTPPRVVGDDDAHHFVVIEGSRTVLNVKVITADGAIIDDFSLRPQET